MQQKKFFLRLTAGQAALMVALIEIILIVLIFIVEGQIIGLSAVKKNELEENVDDVVEDEKANAVLGLGITCLIALIFPLILLIGVLWGKRYLTMPWIVFGFIRLIGGIYYIFHIWNEDFGNWYFFFCICAAIYYYLWNFYSMYVVISAYRSRSSASPSNQIAMNIAS